MAITGISSSNTVQDSLLFVSQPRQDFSAMITALKSGDVDGAKEALSELKQDVKNIRDKITDNGTAPFFGTRPVEDIQTLQSALQTGDMAEAKKAFHLLMQDLRQIGRRQLALHYFQSKQGSGTAVDLTA